MTSDIESLLEETLGFSLGFTIFHVGVISITVTSDIVISKHTIWNSKHTVFETPR